MISIEYLRQFRLGEYAIFDLAVSFLGIYLLSPLLSKLFRRLRIDIPKRNWIFLTLPIGILTHLIVGRMTPMTQNFNNLHGHYLLKIIILASLVLGLRGTKIIRKTAKNTSHKK
jgi:hypothetical protein